jgi:uncharacterized protein with beta-barrel porin domain
VPLSTNAFSGGAEFTVAGVPLAKNVAVLEAGFDTELRRDLTVGASYVGQFGSGVNGFKVDLAWRF